MTALLPLPIDLLTKWIHSTANVQTSSGHLAIKVRVMTLDLVGWVPPTVMGHYRGTPLHTGESDWPWHAYKLKCKHTHAGQWACLSNGMQFYTPQRKHKRKLCSTMWFWPSMAIYLNQLKRKSLSVLGCLRQRAIMHQQREWMSKTKIILTCLDAAHHCDWISAKGQIMVFPGFLGVL